MRSAARWRRRPSASSATPRSSWPRRVPLFADVPAEIRVWASHGDFVAAAPSGFSVVATSANAPVAAMADADRRLYALLFHPEVVHTDHGLEILRNFAYGICGCTGDWTMASFVEEATARIRAQVGDGHVVCALSGGVDSTVAALHHPPRDRRQADVHLRRQRRAAARRSGAGPQAIRAASSASRLRRRGGPVSRAAGRGHRPGEEAQDHRRDVHRRLRAGGRQARDRSISWRRARCIRT